MTVNGRPVHLIFRLDFFIWGYLKEKVYRDRPKTIDELKIAIDSEIKNIPQKMTKNVMKSFQNRLRQCAANGGHHMNDGVLKSDCVYCYNLRDLFKCNKFLEVYFGVSFS